MFREWFTAFSNHGFDFMTYPYLLIYKADMVPYRPIQNFPRDRTQHCLLATAPGNHPTYFRLFFKAQSTDLDCPRSRENGVFTNITWPQKRLAHPNIRSPFRNTEKSVRILFQSLPAHLARWLCPGSIYWDTDNRACLPFQV